MSGRGHRVMTEGDYDDKPYGISPAPNVCCPDAHQGFGDRCSGCGADCTKCRYFEECDFSEADDR